MTVGVDGFMGARVGGGMLVGGDGGGLLAQLFAILMSAQFQNCSGTPCPSAGSGPHHGTLPGSNNGCIGHVDPTGQL
jgi:hypothetical protein